MIFSVEGTSSAAIRWPGPPRGRGESGEETVVPTISPRSIRVRSRRTTMYMSWVEIW